MLGVEGYGSDDDSDVDSTSQPKSTTAPPAATSSKKSPSSSNSAKPGKRPKKITIQLPKLSADVEDNDEGSQQPAKKPRLNSDGKGAGSSSLVAMLPAPKQKNPTITPVSERLLGAGKGPGLVFNASHPSTSAADADEDDGPHVPVASTLFMPTSVSRGKANVSVEESSIRSKPPAAAAVAPFTVDFFSIGESSQPRAATLSETSQAATAYTLSSAPKIEEFTAPEPTPQDPYPGYYLLPSGKYAAYDPEYYQAFYKKWQADYNKYVRDLEKGKIKSLEEIDEDQAIGVNALEEMENAKTDIQAREQRKALTKGDDEPQAPKMNIKGAALGGRAKSRHQLSTLLTEAYQNREAMEERIAQGRRNRKEAGNKYGF